MAMSTAATPGLLFYTTALSTSAATSIYAGPSTAVRTIVTAVYVVNMTTLDAQATVSHRATSSGADIGWLTNTTILANQTIAFGPIVMSSTTSQQSIVGNAVTATSIQVIGYGYLETI